MPVQNHYISYPQQPKIYPPSFPPSNGYSNSKSPYQSPYRSPYRSPDPQNNSQSTLKAKGNEENMKKSCLLLRKKLLENMFECKQCGISFQER